MDDKLDGAFRWCPSTIEMGVQGVAMVLALVRLGWLFFLKNPVSPELLVKYGDFAKTKPRQKWRSVSIGTVLPVQFRGL